MASKIVDIAFNAGQDESADSVWQPADKLRLLSNGRLTRDGRIEVRPGYTALTTSIFGSGTLRAFDLATFDDRLVAYATTDSTDVGADNVYEYNEARARWVAPFQASSIASFPPISDIQIIWESRSGVTWTNADIAYANGYICVVHCDSRSTGLFGQQTAYIEIMRADSGQRIFQTTIAALGARVIGVGNFFVILIKTPTSTITARTFNTPSDTVLSGAVTIKSNAAAYAWDACAIPGSTTDFVFVYSNSSTGAIEINRLQIGSLGSPVWGNSEAAVQGHCTVSCGAAGENTIITWTPTGAGTLRAKTVTTNGGITVQAAATVIAANVREVQPRACRSNATQSHVIAAEASGDLFTTTLTNAAFGVPTVTQLSQYRCTSKPVPIAKTSGTSCAFAMAAYEAGATSAGSASTAMRSSCILGVAGQVETTPGARWNQGFAGRFDAETFDTTEDVGAPSLVTDGANTCWGLSAALSDVAVGSGLDEPSRLQVVRFKARATDRRPSVEMQGGLYIAGGAVGHYDGYETPEAGYLEVPRVNSITSSNSTGSLTVASTYNYVVVWEWTDRRGRVHRSPPSVPRAVTMGAAEDTNSLTITTPHSFRRATQGNPVTVALYRTLADDSTFYRVFDGQSNTSFAANITIIDGVSDADAAVRPVLYTQAQTPDAHFAPLPTRFMAAGKDRIICGGHPDPYLVTFSKLPFPGEPIQWGSPNAFKYQARLNEPVTAVASLGDSYLAFTADAIYEIPGAGPQRNGQGEFFYPRELYSDGGCINWQSLVFCADGLFFQEANDKLSLFDGQGVTNIEAVRDVLTSYPRITGAVCLSERQEVYFACQNSAGSDGVLLCYDLRRKAWSVDPVGAVKSLVEYNGRLAYIQGTTVFLQDAAAGTGTAPTLDIKIGDIRLFPVMGRGDAYKIGVLVTRLGDCNVELLISYDGGVSFVSCDTQALTAANGYTANQIIQLQFDPARHDVDRFWLEVKVTGTSNTALARIHALSIFAEGEDFLTRLPSGQLK